MSAITKKDVKAQHKAEISEIKSKHKGSYTKEHLALFKECMTPLEFIKEKLAMPYSHAFSFEKLQAKENEQRGDNYKKIKPQYGKLTLDCDRLWKHVCDKIHEGKFVSVQAKRNGVHAILFLQFEREEKGNVYFKLTHSEGKRGVWEGNDRTKGWDQVVKCIIGDFNFELPRNLIDKCVGPPNECKGLFVNAELVSGYTTHEAVSQYVFKFANPSTNIEDRKQIIERDLQLELFGVGLYSPAYGFESEELKSIPLGVACEILRHWNGKTYQHRFLQKEFRVSRVNALDYGTAPTDEDFNCFALFYHENTQRNAREGVDECEGIMLKAGRMNEQFVWKVKKIYSKKRGMHLIKPGPEWSLPVYFCSLSNTPVGFSLAPPRDPAFPNVGTEVFTVNFELIPDKERNPYGLVAYGCTKLACFEDMFGLITRNLSRCHATSKGRSEGGLTLFTWGGLEYWLPNSQLKVATTVVRIFDMTFLQQETNDPIPILMQVNQVTELPNKRRVLDTAVCYGVVRPDVVACNLGELHGRLMNPDELFKPDEKISMNRYTVDTDWDEKAFRKYLFENTCNPHTEKQLKDVKAVQVYAWVNSCFNKRLKDSGSCSRGCQLTSKPVQVLDMKATVGTLVVKTSTTATASHDSQDSKTISSSWLAWMKKKQVAAQSVAKTISCTQPAKASTPCTQPAKASAPCAQPAKASTPCAQPATVQVTNTKVTVGTSVVKPTSTATVSNDSKDSKTISASSLAFFQRMRKNAKPVASSAQIASTPSARLVTPSTPVTQCLPAKRSLDQPTSPPLPIKKQVVKSTPSPWFKVQGTVEVVPWSSNLEPPKNAEHKTTMNPESVKKLMKYLKRSKERLEPKQP